MLHRIVFFVAVSLTLNNTGWSQVNFLRQNWDEETRQFAVRLIRGARREQEEIDRILRSVTRNWDLRRMAAVDRNILRMAIYELIHCPDIPPKVSINEAVNMAKKFSQEDSGKFVNGVLDKINHTEKPRYAQ